MSAGVLRYLGVRRDVAARSDFPRSTRVLIKKMVLRVAGLLLALYLGWVVVIGYSSAQRMAWNTQSHDFLRTALIPVLNDPSVFAFRALADRRWRRDLNQDGRPLARTLSHLGPLQAFRVRGGAGLLWRHGLTIVARYRLHARFQKGAAVFRVALVKRHGSWRVSRLRIIREGRFS